MKNLFRLVDQSHRCNRNDNPNDQWRSISSTVRLFHRHHCYSPTSSPITFNSTVRRQNIRSSCEYIDVIPIALSLLNESCRSQALYNIHVHNVAMFKMPFMRYHRRHRQCTYAYAASVAAASQCSDCKRLQL